jgi:hypothetical protein
MRRHPFVVEDLQRAAGDNREPKFTVETVEPTQGLEDAEQREHARLLAGDDRVVVATVRLGGEPQQMVEFVIGQQTLDPFDRIAGNDRLMSQFDRSRTQPGEQRLVSAEQQAAFPRRWRHCVASEADRTPDRHEGA